MSNSSSSSSGGVGFIGLLTITFVVLKLTHVITWSWWWVLSPLWIAAVLVALIFTLVLLVIWAVEYSPWGKRIKARRRAKLEAEREERWRRIRGQ